MHPRPSTPASLEMPRSGAGGLANAPALGTVRRLRGLTALGGVALRRFCQVALFVAILGLVAVLGLATSRADDAVDTAFRAAQIGGMLAGVTLGDTEMAVAKGLVRCAIGPNASLLNCVREELIKTLPGPAQPFAQCLLGPGGSTETCAKQTVITQLQLPPEAKGLAECIAHEANVVSCGKQFALTEGQKAAFSAVDGLRADAGSELGASGQIKNIICIAKAAQKSDWGSLVGCMGVEAAKIAAKALLRVFLESVGLGWLAQFLSPAVDATIQNRADLIERALNAAKAGDEAGLIQVAAEAYVYLNMPVAQICALIPDQKARDRVCGEFQRRLGNAARRAGACGDAVLQGDTRAVSENCPRAAGSLPIPPTTGGSSPGVPLPGLGLHGPGGALPGVSQVPVGANPIAAISIGCFASGVLIDINPCEEAGNWLGRRLGDLFNDDDDRRKSDAECQGYAHLAVVQNNQNLQWQCGLSGPAWHPGYNIHLNWCRSARRDTVDREAQARYDALMRCKNCGDYVRKAKDDIRTARQNGCYEELAAGNPTRWSEGMHHFNFCMSGARESTLGQEMNARAEGARRVCRPAPPPRKCPDGWSGTYPTCCHPGTSYRNGRCEAVVVPPPPPPSPHVTEHPNSLLQPMVVCPDGSRVARGTPCPLSYVTCPDGSRVARGTACPQPMVACPDGSRVARGRSCPLSYVTCPDGSRVARGTACPRRPCPAGTVGIWPNCQHPQTCQQYGMQGRWPHCNRQRQPQPTSRPPQTCQQYGMTGVWPKCFRLN